jgi:hypothetical protein
LFEGWGDIIMARINANITGEAYQALKSLQENSGKTISELLRDAIKLEKYLYDARTTEGKKILLEKDGKITELLLR